MTAMGVRLNSTATGTLDGIGRQDHSITSEYWIVGPPGTGKTKSTSQQVQRAAERYGFGAVLVTSFSRAAAAELASRDLRINPEHLGTMHSICYRALGAPRIAEAHVKEWNRSHPHEILTAVRTMGRIEGEDPMEDDLGQRKPSGDVLLQELNRYRGLMVGPQQWPANIRDFHRRWREYKHEWRLVDFCDLIDICLSDVPVAPGNPSVIFADEAQDLSAIQVRLLRKWSKHAVYSVLAFDDDQAIYYFIGASPEALLDSDIPEDHKVVLRQSYRLPGAVHGLADSLIHQVLHRQEKPHLPRPARGAVYRLAGTYRSPDYSILASAMKHLEQGKTVMLLASCSYMLRPIIQVLRKRKIPFHNPYRKSNGLWNPLRLGARSTTMRILSLLVAHPEYGEGQRQWAHRDISLWIEYLRQDSVLQTDAKELLEGSDGKELVTLERLGQIFEAGALNALLAALEGEWQELLKWWRDHVTTEYRDRIRFPADIVDRHGPQILVEEPRVVVGTIHSVKGGEADVVYLFPDLSRAGDEQYQRFGPARESMIRVFYVGATRARETLYICQAQTARAIAI
jgi:DNA helicase II / ATP-dependent DNA helicase PcrA